MNISFDSVSEKNIILQTILYALSLLGAPKYI